MTKLASKTQCTGCTACMNICPHQCLDMKIDKTGFDFLILKEEMKCESCGICEKICPILSDHSTKEQLTKAYGDFSKNVINRRESSFGGIFSELAETVLLSKGIVYGVSYGCKGTVRHIQVSDRKSLEKSLVIQYHQ